MKLPKELQQKKQVKNKRKEKRKREKNNRRFVTDNAQKLLEKVY